MSLSSELPETRAPEERSHVATWVLRVVVLLVFGILTAQLWRLQIVGGQTFNAASTDNWLRKASIPPQRGVIYDRNGTILASNAPVFVVTLTPADVPRGQMDDVVIRAANALNVPPDQIQTIVNKRTARSDYNPYDAIPIKSNVDRDAVMRLSERMPTMPGVQISVDSTRHYADGELTSQIVGYMGPIASDDADKYKALGYQADDQVGAAGVEAQYEQDLHGTPGQRLYQVDVTGQEVGEIQREDATPGANLVLSIDINLQQDVMKILQEGLSGPDDSGAAIVMNPNNGEILAMASTPTFDNNIINDPARQGELEDLLQNTQTQPMFPRAYGGEYAPGSVFKLVTGSASLQEGVITPETVLNSPGYMLVQRDGAPGVVDRLPDTWAYGDENFFQALGNSSNVYFWWLGGGFEQNGTQIFQGLGVDRLAKYARAYGYGSKTGLDIPGEQPGLIPDAAWKAAHENASWYTGDTYNMAIGQGDVLTTPLQVANVTNAIANGGTLYQPHVAHDEVDGSGNTIKTFQPQVIRQVPVDASHLATMRSAMEWNFQGPWLKWFSTPDLRMAGKTGTAEYGQPDDKGNLPTHGWFTGFAPADDPQITVTVFVEHGSGTLGASPIAARIFRRYFGLPDIPATPPNVPYETIPTPPPPPNVLHAGGD